MYSTILFPPISLQLLAEGGTGEGAATGVSEAAAVPQTKGVKANPLADVKYGIQEEAEPQAAAEEQEEAPIDRKAEFEKLIKGDYKDEYNRRVADTVQKRLRGSQDTVAKYEALTPVLEMLAEKYGVKDITDIKALKGALEEDSSFYEQESIDTGIPVDQLKAMKKVERENAELRRTLQEEENRKSADKLYASWMQQAEETKQVYPEFDMEAEMQNPQFLDLLRANVGVQTAYLVLHKDEIIPAAMQFTAKSVEEKLANKIRSGGNRPAEGGMGSGAAALVKSDVSQLSKEDRAEIIRRVARGEKIRF